MVKVIISDKTRKQLVQLQYAANVTWRKALNSQGFCSFDLPLSDPYCTPTYINPGNFVHIFSDTADSTSFSNAQWGGQLTNDYQIKPNDGVITIAAAGLANLLEASIVPATTSYSILDTGTVINDIITTSDNWSKLGLTPYTISLGGAIIQNFVAGFGDLALEDVYTLCADYGMDFEVRPDWTYGIYIREGQNRPDLVMRYGNQGNVQVDSKMNLVNTEMGNQVWYIDNSGNQVYVANQTSIQYYGPKTIVVQDGQTYTAEDALTKAQLYVTKTAFPLYMMDNVTMVDTPLYSFDQIVLGDSVQFEAPDLPILQSFVGLQRILEINYDDRKQTMTFTLGNALYKMVKGAIHEVRLYDTQNSPFIGTQAGQ